MNLVSLGFIIPLWSPEKYYFECVVKINDEKDGTEVTYNGTVEHINRLLLSIAYIAGLNCDTVTIVSPRLQNKLTEEFVVNKNTSRICHDNDDNISCP